MRRFGYKKGAISAAGVEAIDQLLRHVKSQEYLHKISNPTQLLKGMLKHVKRGSVDLQHQVTLIF